MCNLNSILLGIQQLYTGPFDINLSLLVLALRLSYSGLIFPTLMNEFIFPRKIKLCDRYWQLTKDCKTLPPSFVMHQPGSDTVSKSEVSNFQVLGKKRKRSLFEITVTFLIKRFLSPN